MLVKSGVLGYTACIPNNIHSTIKRKFLEVLTWKLNANILLIQFLLI